MVQLTQRGSFGGIEAFLKRPVDPTLKKYLEKYAKAGLDALKAATPKDTGLTAASWYYEIVCEKGHSEIRYCNSNIQNGVPIAVILQNGHATRNGGWVQGIDYIDPAIRPVFEKIAKEAWEEVSK